MEVETWLLYLLTCCGIALVPGPNALLVLTHGACMAIAGRCSRLPAA